MGEDATGWMDTGATWVEGDSRPPALRLAFRHSMRMAANTVLLAWTALPVQREWGRWESHQHATQHVELR